MTARRVTLALVAALAVYLLVFVDIAVGAFRTGRPLGIGIGVGVLLLPVLTVPLVVGELRLARAAERLGRDLAAEQGASAAGPPPRTAGGRVDVRAADAVFDVRRAAVEAAPADWRAWYLLALAYGDARDTGRGRRAMRRAVALHAAAARPRLVD